MNLQKNGATIKNQTKTRILASPRLLQYFERQNNLRWL
jgi:hypothetical protein